MNNSLSIKYIQHHNIDKKKWDECIEGACNGLIYGYSFYLDAMAGQWDGLVLNDYEIVMPLPWRRKYGFYYLYQPSFTAQLGVFGIGLNAEILTAFFNAIPQKFSYWDFSLNHQNCFSVAGHALNERNNFKLNLHAPYQSLYENYRENIKRNIKKCASYNCSVKKDVSIESIIALAKGQHGAVADSDFTKFEALLNQLHKKELAKTYGILSHNGELLASAAFTFSHNRAYYILVGNHPNGRTLGASHALIDAFINDHAQQNLWLDFEGSDLRNLAFFYSSFGAEQEKYVAIHLNRLPWYAKWLKK